MKPHSHRSDQNTLVSTCACFPQSSSLVSLKFQERHEHATPRAVRLVLQVHCQQEWLEIGLLTQFLLRQLSRFCTENTALVPLASASQDYF